MLRLKRTENSIEQFFVFESPNIFFSAIILIEPQFDSHRISCMLMEIYRNIYSWLIIFSQIINVSVGMNIWPHINVPLHDLQNWNCNNLNIKLMNVCLLCLVEIFLISTENGHWNWSVSNISRKLSTNYTRILRERVFGGASWCCETVSDAQFLYLAWMGGG